MFNPETNTVTSNYACFDGKSVTLSKPGSRYYKAIKECMQFGAKNGYDELLLAITYPDDTNKRFKGIPGTDVYAIMRSIDSLRAQGSLKTEFKEAIEILKYFAKNAKAEGDSLSDEDRLKVLIEIYNKRYVGFDYHNECEKITEVEAETGIYSTSTPMAAAGASSGASRGIEGPSPRSEEAPAAGAGAVDTSWMGREWESTIAGPAGAFYS